MRGAHRGAQTPWRRFDQAQIACHTVLALLLGVGSIEQVKTLLRAQAGPLTGTPVSPELHTLRPRLSAIADQVGRARTATHPGQRDAGTGR